jgi:Uma2 family endonuclease
MTWSEYLALDETSDAKHEYHDGVAVCMAGGTLKHGKVAGNILTALQKRLAGRPCQPFNSDVRLRTGPRTHYPDVSVICGKPQMDKDVPNTVINPSVIFEVLSKATEGYDRGLKFYYYREIKSLTDYVLVSPTDELTEHYALQSDGRWVLTILPKFGTLRLDGIGCEIPITEFFADMEMLRDLPEEE